MSEGLESNYNSMKWTSERKRFLFINAVRQEVTISNWIFVKMLPRAYSLFAWHTNYGVAVEDAVLNASLLLGKIEKKKYSKLIRILLISLQELIV